GCYLVVAKVLAAKQQQFRVAGLNHSQYQPDSLLLLGGSPNIFRGGNRPDKSKEAFVARPARSPPQLIQTFSYRRPVQPRFRLLSLSFRAPPQLQKHLYCKFFRSCRIVDDPANNAGNALVLSAEHCLEIE